MGEQTWPPPRTDVQKLPAVQSLVEESGVQLWPGCLAPTPRHNPNVEPCTGIHWVSGPQAPYCEPLSQTSAQALPPPLSPMHVAAGFEQV